MTPVTPLLAPKMMFRAGNGKEILRTELLGKSCGVFKLFPWGCEGMSPLFTSGEPLSTLLCGTCSGFRGKQDLGDANVSVREPVCTLVLLRWEETSPGVQKNPGFRRRAWDKNMPHCAGGKWEQSEERG